MALQRTLKTPVKITGKGLHSGSEIDLKMFPAPVDHGIVFKRGSILIPATAEYASRSPLCTTISNEGAKVMTIEHLMSALNALEIDNLLIEISDQEVPILDGSSYLFVKEFKDVGITEQPAEKRYIEILETVVYQEDDKLAYLAPDNKSSFTYYIDFDHDFIKRQEFTFNLTEKYYIENIAQAKTFCLEKEVELLQSRGLIKGGSLENAIVLDSEKGVVNENYLTFLTEPNVHKVLDAIGDMFLFNNMRIIGHFYGHKSSHAMNLSLIQKILSQPDSYRII